MRFFRPSPRPSGPFTKPGKSPGGRPVIAWGLLLSLGFALLFLYHPHLLQSLDCIIYDLFLRNFPGNKPSSRVAIVDIDEKSLNRYGQWPWPRYRVADLLEKTAAMGPAAIGLDIIFAEPDRTSAERVLKDLGNAHGLSIKVRGISASYSDNDRILAETLARGPFVLGNKFHFNPLEKSSEACVLHPVKTAIVSSEEAAGKHSGIPESTGVLCNLPMLAEQVDASGFFNFSPDADGMLRRLPLLIQHNGSVHAALGLAAVLKAQENPGIMLKKTGSVLSSLNFCGISAPVDPHGQLLIKFRGTRRGYDTISAADILDGRVPAHRLIGRIVFAGTSAAGLKDLITTPFDPIFPGVEVHATVADNLLSGDFLSEPHASMGVAFTLILVSGILLSFAIAYKSASAGFMVLCLFTAGLLLGAQQVFYHSGIFMGTAFPVASIAGLYLLLGAIKFRVEEKRMISGMKELVITQDITIESMANLSECRDPETGGHIRRTRRYVRLLAEHLKHHERFRHFLTDETIDLLYKSAPLHDIGKVGIPDAILLKPDRLTEAEFEIMKTHTTMGRDVIASSAGILGRDSFLNLAAEMAYSHQEKWDGTGYPLGIRGEEIPISGRLMALADVYDALISRRTYKPPLSHDLAVKMIEKGRGTHFDPDVVDTFLEVRDQFNAIARQFADAGEEKSALG